MFNKLIIHKNNLINNILAAKAQKPNQKICAMVKANAYGVGEQQVVKILNNHADFFGVVCFFEAERIKHLTNKKILITGPLNLRHISKRYSYTCNSLKDVLALRRLNKKLNIHLKINTGMNRYGISNLVEFERAIIAIQNTKLNLEGVYTHFATTDEFVESQVENFNAYLNILKKYGLKPIIHADNSHVFSTRAHNFDMARLGFNLFNSSVEPYKPVVEIETEITQVNEIKAGALVGYDRRFVAKSDMRVAVIPIGYADGFDMHYLGMGISVGGKNCKVLNICMDCFMLNITKTKLKKGDRISILNSANPLSRYALKAKTSEYEVMCKFGSMRADRVVR